MRPIKFRAWGGHDEKYFVYFSLLNQNEDTVVSDDEDKDGGNILLDKEEVECTEQWTGLLDKNGIPIFEGDLLKDDDSLNVVEVFWDDDLARFGVRWANNHVASEHGVDVRCEVVGNVHEMI